MHRRCIRDNKSKTHFSFLTKSAYDLGNKKVYERSLVIKGDNFLNFLF